MRVLLVEDDEQKLMELIRFLHERYGIDSPPVAKSLQSGLVAALREEYDLILLDMTMRNFDRTIEDDGGRPHAFAGREILRQMRRHKRKSPVIIVTHFERFGNETDFVTLEALKEDLRASFPNYRGTVQYKLNIDEWKADLGAAILGLRSKA